LIPIQYEAPRPGSPQILSGKGSIPCSGERKMVLVWCVAIDSAVPARECHPPKWRKPLKKTDTDNRFKIVSIGYKINKLPTKI
ncbi:MULTISPECIES: hypothetical protein, partial [unclassified Microcoleus]|uniref:hypothetical protein n=1 Tax=unclassified Microcoleus TaxID=2642155 RepID=UPI0025EBBFB5